MPLGEDFEQSDLDSTKQRLFTLNKDSQGSLYNESSGLVRAFKKKSQHDRPSTIEVASTQFIAKSWRTGGTSRKTL